MIALCESAITPLRPSKVIGISLVTFDMDEDAARAEIARIQQVTGLPTTDPVRFGAEPLAEAILAGAAAKRDGVGAKPQQG